jgi:hypothetical protein
MSIKICPISIFPKESQQPKQPKRSLLSKIASLFACSQEPPKSLNTLHIEVREAQIERFGAMQKRMEHESDFAGHYAQQVKHEQDMLNLSNQGAGSRFLSAASNEERERNLAQESLNLAAVARLDEEAAQRKEEALQKQIDKLQK